MILRLPNGYATRIGERGASLSAGQRQRIGLARAVFGDPFLIVLDEPNANLDGDGEMALMRAIEALRKNQCIVVLVSHRPDAIAALNVAMVLYDGRMIAFGPREEIFARVAKSSAKSSANIAANSPANASIKPSTPPKPKIASAENPARAVRGVPP
jgi:ABC-type protease/lipase transport system fused ATPase/permease subunit